MEEKHIEELRGLYISGVEHLQAWGDDYNEGGSGFEKWAVGLRSWEEKVVAAMRAGGIYRSHVFLFATMGETYGARDNLRKKLKKLRKIVARLLAEPVAVGYQPNETPLF